jgi:hypothetical protein
MQFTSRSMSDNFHSGRREMSRSYFPGNDTSQTSGRALLIDEHSDFMSAFDGHPSRNSSRSPLLLWQPLIVAFAGLALR